MLTIDRTTYQKTAFPLRHGYDRRPAGVRPSGIIIHSTNNARRTSFAGEAKYLYEAATVSSHYLIGKSADQGVVQFLPDTLRAWHAGEAKPSWGNTETIGIELHTSVGELPTGYQIQALGLLVRNLMQTWDIPEDRIDTHRAVAQPLGRKRDPEGWPDPLFYQWRSALVAAADPWSAWGDDYPLPVDQRHFGIPALWYENRRWLKAARSFPWYPPGVAGFVAQLFQGGLVWGVDGIYQVKQFTKELP